MAMTYSGYEFHVGNPLRRSIFNANLQQEAEI